MNIIVTKQIIRYIFYVQLLNKSDFTIVNHLKKIVNNMKVVMKKTSIFVDIIKDSEIEFLYIYFFTNFFSDQNKVKSLAQV